MHYQRYLGALVVLKGEKTFKNLYKLIGETTIKGGMPSGVKGKEEPLVMISQMKDNHGCKKGRFVANETNKVVKPSSTMVVKKSLSEKFKHCLFSIESTSC